MNNPQVKPQYINAIISQNKTVWINKRPVDGLIYLQSYNDKVYMFSRFICAN